MDRLRLGIIGIGNMGTQHVRSIMEGQVPNVELTAVADINPARLDYVKQTFGDGIACFDSAQALMDSGLCEAVHIAVPHYFHPPLAIEAFGRGLHVMCEKPAGVYTKQVKEMNAVAAASGKRFAMMFNQRTNHVYREMKRIVESGELGAIKRTNWLITDWYRTQSYYDSGDWRATWAGEGGGVLLNQCPHNLDLMQWICGMPIKVQAFCHMGKWHDIEVEDDVTAYMEYRNGATGVFITSTGDAPGTNRFEITGEMGKLVCEDGKLTFWKLRQNEREFSRTNPNGFAKPECVVIEPQTDGMNEQHVGVLKAFAAAILDGTPMVAEGCEGINGLTLSNAMHLSSWLGHPVEIPFDEDLYLEELNKRVALSCVKSGHNTYADISDTYGSNRS